MKYFGLSLILGISFFSCNKSGIAPNTPNCVEDKIEQFQISKICESGSSVKQYKFQGEFVYAFEQGNCGNDLETEIIDEECKTLGFIGGLSGNTLINGGNFENAIFQLTSWED